MAGDSSATACDGLSVEMSGSDQIAAGSGTDSWWPMCIGSCSHIAFGSTRRRTSSSTSPIGRPVAGAGSSNAAITSAISGGDRRRHLARPRGSQVLLDQVDERVPGREVVRHLGRDHARRPVATRNTSTLWARTPSGRSVFSVA